MKLNFSRSILAILLPFLVIAVEHISAGEKPNVIVIMADDLGYGDLSCYGATAVKTPNIDKLAAGGCRFTSGYCSASTCTPTRYSLLTGNYALRFPRTGIAAPNSPAIIEPGTETIATIFKKAGYSTAVVGKWHLGLGIEKPDWNHDLKPGPLEIGFDYCYVLPTTNDRVPQIYVENHRVKNLDPLDPLDIGDDKPSGDHPTGLTQRDTLKMDWSHGHNQTIHNGISRIGFYTGGKAARFRDEDLADAWVNTSIKWIEEHREKPFFLYFASHDIHVPRMPHERFQKQTTLGYRGDAIVEFDWSVGEIMKALDRLNLTKNTMVVVCSDNGPVLDDGYKDGAVEQLGKHLPAGPFKGGKYTVYEGGTRTPFITSWPGKIEPGVSKEIVCTIDLPASFAQMLKVELPETACIDSINVMPALLKEAGAHGRDALLQQDNNGKSLGLRMGNWKLVRNKSNFAEASRKYAGKSLPGKSNKDELYDLGSDPGEVKNLADIHVEKLMELQAKLDKIVNDGRTRY